VERLSTSSMVVALWVVLMTHIPILAYQSFLRLKSMLQTPCLRKNCLAVMVVSKKKETAKKESDKPAASTTPVLTKEEMARFNREPAQPERDIFAEILAQRKEDREAIKKSAAEDRNLALLAAGLGMMGGTSPYAFANIGAGGAKGVEALAASKARRAAELNALNKAETEALYYGEEVRRRNLAQQSLEMSRAMDDLAAYDAKIRKGIFIEGVAETPKQREAYENEKRNNPIYQRLLRNANMSTVQAQQPNRVSYFNLPQR